MLRVFVRDSSGRDVLSHGLPMESTSSDRKWDDDMVSLTLRAEMSSEMALRLALFHKNVFLGRALTLMALTLVIHKQ